MQGHHVFAKIVMQIPNLARRSSSSSCRQSNYLVEDMRVSKSATIPHKN